MIIVDTTVWIDYLFGVATLQSEWLDQALTRHRVALTDLTLCEILQGLRSDSAAARTRNHLLAFRVFNTGGQELAVASAQNYRLLRARGFTVRKTIDCIIATFCLSEGHTLLHRDRDFDPFEEHLGLQVVHPRTY